MTQSPAGWYPEPDPNHVGPPGRLRYWDGSAWTEHVHDPQAPIAPAPPTYPDPGQQYPGQQAQQSAPDQAGFAPIGGGQPEYPSSTPAASYPTQPQAPYGQQPYGQYPTQPVAYGGDPTTPDGVRLAGWWQRVLARILDFFISLPLIAIALVPLISSQWDSLEQWVDDLDYASTYGTEDPAAPALFDFTTGPGISLLLIFMIVPLLYDIVFLLWKQATPGKMIVGLKVRLRERPELPAGNVFGRVGTTFLLNICWLGALLDVLWPLWDEKKQALHDKAAATNVVRTR